VKKPAAVILAAGKGTRMKDNLPKVLHEVAGRTMVNQVVSTAKTVGVDQILLVVGNGSKKVQEVMGPNYDYVLQEPQLGTGHAVMTALPALSADTQAVLVLSGDAPLLSSETLQKLLDQFEQDKASCTMLTAVLPKPGSYGRVIRDNSGQVMRIKELKDANEKERLVQEINTGTYCFRKEDLTAALAHINRDNAQAEYYLTDTIAWMVAQGKLVSTYTVSDWQEILGVNDLVQLATANRILHLRKNNQLMLSGVNILDPDHTYIDWDVKVGKDTIIEPNTFLRRNTSIGSNCYIGPDSDIKDSIVGDGCTIFKAVIVESSMGSGCNIGPFAYLRPGTVLADNVKVGDFVEIKKSQIGCGSKIPHLSYMGDSILGQGVNIGCGTITCNYDGFSKHQTIIGDEVFVGSNSNLVAPVEIQARSVIAAGSTITHMVPADSMAVARSRQVNMDGRAAKRREILLALKKQREENVQDSPEK